MSVPEKTTRKRRWIPCVFLALFAAWIISIQTGCLAMRTPDRDWPAKLQQRGQSLLPAFHDIDMPGYRTIHAVSLNSDSSKPLIVFVHGSPGSADAFLSYLADTALSRLAGMISIDRPGFGYTKGFGRAEGSLGRQAAAVEAVVQRLAPGKKVVLVGHSLGGPVIARFAMDYPEKTAGLVMVAASIDPDLEEHPWWQGAVDAPPLRWLTPKSLWTSNREIKLLEAELRQILPRWADIRCPVTMVHAKDDRLVPFANVAFAKRMLVNCPRYSEVILEKGDHFILWSRQDVMRGAMVEMLDALVQKRITQ